MNFKLLKGIYNNNKIIKKMKKFLAILCISVLLVACTTETTEVETTEAETTEVITDETPTDSTTVAEEITEEVTE